MVAPDLEIPGSTAKAWAIPIIKASRKRIFLKFDFTNIVEASSAEVISSIEPTNTIFPVKNCSTSSIKNKPIIKTGIMETINLRIYNVSSFRLN